MKHQPVNLGEKLDLVHELWQPKVIAEMNDYQFKIVKVKGEFVRHDHKDTDEAFLVVDGELRIDFREGSVTIGPGELYVVRRGLEHRPYAAKETHVLVIEPRGVVNTGDAGGDMTAESDVWV